MKVLIEGMEYVPISWLAAKNADAEGLRAEIIRLRETLKKEQECHFAEEKSALCTMQNALAEIDRLKNEKRALCAKVDEQGAVIRKHTANTSLLAAYRREFPLACKRNVERSKVIAIYENAIDCLTAELEDLKTVRFPSPYHVALEAEIAAAKAANDTANEAIKLLGEGFAREINAANAYAWGLEDLKNLFIGIPNSKAFKTVISALGRGDAARKAPKA